MTCFIKLSLLALICIIACSNPTNNHAISLSELDSIQAEDKKLLEDNTFKREILTAAELIDLADCSDINCVQFYMKNLSGDFVQGYKGEFYAQRRIRIKDTAGNEQILPASTFYVDVNPQASWRAAHTVHTKAQGDSLLNEFKQLGFQVVADAQAPQNIFRYDSEKYPGKLLSVTATYKPWYMKGLYEKKVTWLCYVFEVYKNQL